MVEKFSPGRPDRLKEHEYFRVSSSHPTEFVSKFYWDARQDGLEERRFRELDLSERYRERPDRLRSMRVTFVVGEKKFGPAEATSSRGQKTIAKIVEK